MPACQAWGRNRGTAAARPALTQRFVPQQVGKCGRHDLDPTQVDAVLAENGVNRSG